MGLLASAVVLGLLCMGACRWHQRWACWHQRWIFSHLLCKPLQAEYFVDSNYQRKPFEYMVFTFYWWFDFFQILLSDFKRSWEILRNFERFWEILRNFHFTQQYYFSITMVPMPLSLRDFERFWEILRDFEKFWEILRNFEFFFQWKARKGKVVFVEEK